MNKVINKQIQMHVFLMFYEQVKYFTIWVKNYNSSHEHRHILSHFVQDLLIFVFESNQSIPTNLENKHSIESLYLCIFMRST